MGNQGISFKENFFDHTESVFDLCQMLAIFQKGLLLGGMVMTGLLIVSFLDIPKFQEKNSMGSGSEELDIHGFVIPQQRPLNEYEIISEKKDIFNPSWNSDTRQKNSSEAMVDETKLADFMNRFKLVGVVLDKNPQAVIEDDSTGQSLFLYKGQSIDGATIEDIKEGRVKIRSNGRMMELTE